jgi:hypothetical protein
LAFLYKTQRHLLGPAADLGWRDQVPQTDLLILELPPQLPLAILELLDLVAADKLSPAEMDQPQGYCSQ